MEIVKILELTGKGFNAEQIKQLNDYKLEDVSALLEAGKSTDEVMSLLPIMDKTTAEPPTVPPTEPPTEPPAQNNDALLNEIKQLKATIQANNLKQASITQTPTKPQSADDIIKGFFEDKTQTK